MADDAYAAYTADDAILLNLVRTGEAEAYEVLRQRHEQAASRLARCLVSAEEADIVVDESFAWVRNVTLRGGGPMDAFRPYLLNAVRRVSYDRLCGHLADAPADINPQPDPGELLIDPGMADLAGSLIVRAFRSLPDRWIAVLWHTKIEETSSEETTQILGLSPQEVAALVRRARKGLRQAYVRMLISDVARPKCQPVVRQLGGIVRGAASNNDRAMVTEHLADCDECRAAYTDLTDLNIALRRQAAPVFLGGAVSSYLPNVQAAMTTTAAAETASPRTGMAIAAASTPARDGRSRRVSRRRMWAAAGILAVAAVVAALALALTGPGSPLTPAHRNQPAQAAAAPTAATTTGQPDHKKQKGAAAVPVAASRQARPADTTGANSPAAHPPTGVTGPGPATSPGPGSPAELTMTATLHDLPNDPNPGAFNDLDVAINVSGAATTGDLTVSLALPAGTSLYTGSGAVSAGWTCQPTAAGATCRTGPVAEASEASAEITISVSIPASCGELVQLTAVSGSSSTSGPSANGVDCQ
jgi:DNA-directed RNA polymerase specialized sigma24 family protein/anti-sigma factor RsiW